MTTARLSYDLEEKLDSLSKVRNMAKSDMVREALVEYLAQEETEKGSFELGEAFFGKYGSGDGNRSVDYKNRLKEKLRAKQRSY